MAELREPLTIGWGQECVRMCFIDASRQPNDVPADLCLQLRLSHAKLQPICGDASAMYSIQAGSHDSKLG